MRLGQWGLAMMMVVLFGCGKTDSSEGGGMGSSTDGGPDASGGSGGTANPTIMSVNTVSSMGTTATVSTMTTVTSSSGGSSSSGGGSGNGGGAGLDGSGNHTSTSIPCTSDEECTFVQDCCNCTPTPTTQMPASMPDTCQLGCDDLRCDQLLITTTDITCVAGRCVINRTCNPAAATCNKAPPECPVGTAPEVFRGCFSGVCRRLEHCETVAGCDLCEAAGLLCVTYSGLSNFGHHCVAPPPECDPNDCECLGVCLPPYGCGENLSCFCGGC